MIVIVVLALLLVAPAAGAQCCGDCDGNGEVTINELITAVNNALGVCSDGPTPTPTVPADACPIDFLDDNTQAGTPDCYYIGRWNPSCGAADLEALWRSDGDIVIVELLGFDPGLFVGAEVSGAGSADIIGWYREPDASDLELLDGTVALGGGGASLNVDPVGEGFDIEECPFTRYRGEFDGAVVPSAALRQRRGIDGAVLQRLRGAIATRDRVNLKRNR